MTERGSFDLAAVIEADGALSRGRFRGADLAVRRHRQPVDARHDAQARTPQRASQTMLVTPSTRATTHPRVEELLQRGQGPSNKKTALQSAIVVRASLVHC
jgi:hypothetical protein